MPIDSQFHRLVDALGGFFRRDLEIRNPLASNSPRGGNSVIDTRATLEIFDPSGAIFTDDERRLLQHVIDLAERQQHAQREIDAMSQRLKTLERENADLTLRNRALVDLASRDSLTGLCTRWFFVEKIEAELNRSLRHGSPLALLMIDLDRFRSINDDYGQTTGDLILQAVSSLLKESCRLYDVPGRYGGEEFCLLLPETKLDQTTVVAERIRQRIAANPVPCGSLAVPVTTSIGAAGLENIPDEGLVGASSLLERADRALHAAKQNGRNRVELWSPGLQVRLVEH